VNAGYYNLFPTGLNPAQCRSGEGEGDTQDPYDALVQQTFAVSLDLHAALTLVNNRRAADRIRLAIEGLDHAIDQVQYIVPRLGPAVDIAEQPDRCSAG
jgi:hypothetical protein